MLLVGGDPLRGRGRPSVDSPTARPGSRSARCRRSAVDALAAAAGLAGHGAAGDGPDGRAPARVVECLRALAEGETGVPTRSPRPSSPRVDRLEPSSATACRGAPRCCGGRIDPRLLAALVETSELAAVRRCEELVRARLLQRSGADYEFANDLVQECVHAALPPAAGRWPTTGAPPT